MINSKFFDTDADGIGELHLNNDGYVDGYAYDTGTDGVWDAYRLNTNPDYDTYLETTIWDLYKDGTFYEIHQDTGFDGVADWKDTFVGAPIF